MSKYTLLVSNVVAVAVVAISIAAMDNEASNFKLSGKNRHKIIDFTQRECITANQNVIPKIASSMNEATEKKKQKKCDTPMVAMAEAREHHVSVFGVRGSRFTFNESLNYSCSSQIDAI